MFYFYWIISVYYFSTVYALSWQQMTIPSDVNYTSLERFPAGLSKLSREITYIILTINRFRKYNFNWIRVKELGSTTPNRLNLWTVLLKMSFTV